MEEFLNEWRNLQRALNMHMHMENNGFFQLLDSIGNSAVSNARLGDEHTHDLELQEKVDQAISGSDVSALKEAFKAWSDEHLAHLVHEEEIMMPIIPNAGKTCIDHGQVVHDRLLSVIDSPEEFDWTLGWILNKLMNAKHSEPPPELMVRVFVWGLHYSADDKQWQRWLPIIKDNVPDSLYKQMVDSFHIHRPGRVGVVSDLSEEFSYLPPQDAPRPMPFAVMRNTHEALRSSIQQMNELLKAA